MTWVSDVDGRLMVCSENQAVAGGLPKSGVQF